MKADWRTSLVSEAMQAFATDLNLAVAIVTPRKTVKTSETRVHWGMPPRFVVEELPVGRSQAQAFA